MMRCYLIKIDTDESYGFRIKTTHRHFVVHGACQIKVYLSRALGETTHLIHSSGLFTLNFYKCLQPSTVKFDLRQPVVLEHCRLFKWGDNIRYFCSLS